LKSYKVKSLDFHCGTQGSVSLKLRGEYDDDDDDDDDDTKI